MANPKANVPKSISYSLATAAKVYFDRVLNYSQPCPVYKVVPELAELRTEVFSALALKYDGDFAKASLALFTLKNVNEYVKRIHKKANLSPENEAQQKEMNRLSAVSAKARKGRGIQEKAAEEATKQRTLAILDDQATLADTVVQRARVWESHFYTALGVPVNEIMLLTGNENNLDVLKRDIDLIFNQFRGESSIISPRCCQIVIELERIMDLLRSHGCVQHMAAFVSIREIPPSLLPATVVEAPKQHRGSTSGKKKWRVDDNIDAKLGGLKVLNGNIQNRAASLDKKAEVLFKFTNQRVVEEEKKIDSKGEKSRGRISLRFSKEGAKKESLCPTKLYENTDEALEGLFTLTHFAITIINLKKTCMGC